MYIRYPQTSLQTIAAVGGRVIFGGKAHEALIAPPGEGWHQVFLVQYPSPAAFRAMMALPQYQACVHLRTAALADSRLGPCPRSRHSPDTSWLTAQAGAGQLTPPCHAVMHDAGLQGRTRARVWFHAIAIRFQACLASQR